MPWLSGIFCKNICGKKFLYVIGTKVPVVKCDETIRAPAFCNDFSSLLKAGLPIMNALEIGRSWFFELRESLMRISRGYCQGHDNRRCVPKEPSFPQVVTNLIAVSEKAGILRKY